MAAVRTGSNGDEVTDVPLAGRIGSVVREVPENDYVDVRTRLSGATLKAVAKWALIVMTGTGGIGTAASVVSAQATMAEQVKALQAEVAEVKEKTQDTAEAVARIEGYLSPKRLAPQKKGR